jgi:hypothetical protein
MAEVKVKRHYNGKSAKISAGEVGKLAGYGCTMEDIGDFFGVHKSQICRNFGDAYKVGLHRCKLSLRRWQMRSAEGGQVAMQIWLGKQLLGQREPRQDFAVTELPVIKINLNTITTTPNTAKVK